MTAPLTRRLLDTPGVRMFLAGMKNAVGRIRCDSSYPAEPDFEGFAECLLTALGPEDATREQAYVAAKQYLTPESDMQAEQTARGLVDAIAPLLTAPYVAKLEELKEDARSFWLIEIAASDGAYWWAANDSDVMDIPSMWPEHFTKDPNKAVRFSSSESAWTIIRTFPWEWGRSFKPTDHMWMNPLLPELVAKRDENIGLVAKLAEMEARANQIADNNEAMTENVIHAESRLAAVEAERDRLRKWIAEVARHSNLCASVYEGGYDCDCGLDAALAGGQTK